MALGYIKTLFYFYENRVFNNALQLILSPFENKKDKKGQ